VKKRAYKPKGGKLFPSRQSFTATRRFTTLDELSMPSVELSHHQNGTFSAVGRALSPSDEFSTLLPTK